MTEGTRPPALENAVAAREGVRETTPHVMPARRRSPRQCQKASAGRGAGMRIAIVRAGRRISDSGSPSLPHAHRRMLSNFFRFRFPRNPIRDLHISGPYCSARADGLTPLLRPGARAGCPMHAAPKVARQPRAIEREAFLFPATQRSELRRGR
ncbi:hypothetical protein [Burkholderia multivorans]|uniref:hypothetical protein n=1 Tax=Burkholderia multivorans TaxID=87883 RepID=UPI0015E3A5FA|nr:hypothetical protein [Burkholderia multivorans]